MARKRKQKPSPAPIQFCPECGAARRGNSLVKHCLDKHCGRLPLILCAEDAEYGRAVSSLTKGGDKGMAQ